MAKDTAYTVGDLQSELYTNYRIHFDEFFESEKHFFNAATLKEGMSVLDIGGGAGGLGNALREKFNLNLKYTCIDPDSKAVEAGKKRFGANDTDFKLICDEFPGPLPPTQTWDMVCVIGWFAQVTEWKRFLLTLCERANKYVNIGINVRLTGNTVVDPDVSYVYYFDSGKRIPEITHNIYELFNFASIQEIGAEKIEFYGYHGKGSSSAYRPVPRHELVQGNLLITKNPARMSGKRMGAFSGQTLNALGNKVDSFRPEWKAIIDGKPLQF